jgi:hypothetical protein
MVKLPTIYRLAADRRYQEIPAAVEATTTLVHISDGGFNNQSTTSLSSSAVTDSSSLLKTNEHVSWSDRYGSTALHLLCQARVVDADLLLAVDAILDVAPDEVATPNVATWTPLHFAVEKWPITTPVLRDRRRIEAPRAQDATGTAETQGNEQSSLEEQNAEALEHEDQDEDEDETAHQLAESYATTLILRLIAACPRAVTVRTHSGFKSKTPFHLACEADADYRVLYAMLCIRPSLSTAPYHVHLLEGENAASHYSLVDAYTVVENPIQLLWRNYYQYANHSNSTANNEVAIRALRAKMALLLRAAHMGSVESVPVDSVCAQLQQKPNTTRRVEQHEPPSLPVLPKPGCLTTTIPSHCIATGAVSPTVISQEHCPSHFRLLNAVCTVRCPRDYFLYVFQRDARRQMLRKQRAKRIVSDGSDAEDDDDYGIDMDDDDCDRGKTDSYKVATKDSSGRYPLHYAVRYTSVQSQPYTQYVIETLLPSSEMATSCPDPTNGGRLPLHVLVDEDHMMTWHKGGVRELALAFPNALRVRDPKSQLVPFLASATAATKSRLHLSTTYELLKAAPEMVKQGSTTPRQQSTVLESGPQNSIADIEGVDPGTANRWSIFETNQVYNRGR